MNNAYVAIDGKRYREYLLAKIEELRPFEENELAGLDEWETALDEWEALPFWKKLFVNRPTSPYVRSMYLHMLHRWNDDFDAPQHARIVGLNHVLRGVADDLTYYIPLNEAAWLGIGVKEE